MSKKSSKKMSAENERLVLQLARTRAEAQVLGEQLEASKRPPPAPVPVPVVPAEPTPEDLQTKRTAEVRAQHAALKSDPRRALETAAFVNQHRWDLYPEADKK